MLLRALSFIIHCPTEPAEGENESKPNRKRIGESERTDELEIRWQAAHIDFELKATRRGESIVKRFVFDSKSRQSGKLTAVEGLTMGFEQGGTRPLELHRQGEVESAGPYRHAAKTRPELHDRLVAVELVRLYNANLGFRQQTKREREMTHWYRAGHIKDQSR